ncbi:MAG: hypothetical protein PWQ22_1625 [Archaeoglobaceae archaeon]|nr:hypothetical protein [Archaeoglobaceae archaeon]
MWRYSLIAIVVIATLLSGCMSENPKPTSTPTPTPIPTPAAFNENELVKRIDIKLNPEKYSKYIDYINVAKKGEQLTVSYVAYMSGSEGVLYRQMMRVIDVVGEYLNERDTEIKTVKFKAVDSSGEEYVFEIAREDIPKLLNEQCGFIEWEKAVLHGEKYSCVAQLLPSGTRIENLSQIVEKSFRSDSGSAYLGYVNARLVGSELVVGYASYSTDLENNVYGMMVEVMKVIREYIGEKGLNVEKVKKEWKSKVLERISKRVY